MYVHHLQDHFSTLIGLDIEHERLKEARLRGKHLVNGRSEALPFSSNSFGFVLSHEVLEHVDNDQEAIREIVRALKPGGRLVLLCPNRGYPFETHGVYWRGKYHFGNIPLVNYLPRAWRDKLAPHVNVYTRKDMSKLFENLPVKTIHRSTIFGAYDNIIARRPKLGNLLKRLLQGLEKTPLQRLGLSHFWIIEKV
jgi:ubiquinone/menaquinone biosynthesis C-methylase UbiE